MHVKEEMPYCGLKKKKNTVIFWYLHQVWCYITMLAPLSQSVEDIERADDLPTMLKTSTIINLQNI